MSFYDFISKLIEKCLKFFTVVLIIAALIGFPIMWLWNWLMPLIFHLPLITFWQAIGISVLSSLLFKNSYKVPLKEKPFQENSKAAVGKNGRPLDLE
jgi:hypothetical protein